MEISGAKLMIALWGLGAAFLFAVIFSLIYFYCFRKDAFSLKLFWISGVSLVLLLFIKALISSLSRGYISDRLIFYGIFSPKALGFLWLLGVILIFILFLYFREKLENLPTFKFLFALYIVFILFSVGVAAIREGFFGVYEPFTRIHWEYAGNLPLISNIHNFLRDYVSLVPSLAEHARTHPPGYTVILYIFQKYLWAGFAGLSILTVMLGGLTIFPLYYFLKNFATELEIRRGLQFFVFLPSVVMMTATSMETTFLFFSWVAITLIYVGWRRSWLISFLGGIMVAFSLFLNYLFLLLAPLFLLLLFIIYKKGEKLQKLILRIVFAILGLLFFYIAIYFWTDYSIIQNFMVSRGVQGEVVRSNFESSFIYLAYFIMNLVSFGVYFGIPNIYLLFNNFKEVMNQEHLEAWLGFIMVAIFLLIGVFQGETERIWLFLAPLFILPLVKVIRNFTFSQVSALLSFLFFQIVFTQILFYTYW